MGRQVLPKEARADVSTVDGRNPAHQLRLVVSPMIYKVLAPSHVVIAGFLNHMPSFKPSFKTRSKAAKLNCYCFFRWDLHICLTGEG